jgi:hypothetical protein
MISNLSEHDEHSNNFRLALKHFPNGMFIMVTCIACLCSPWLYHFFRQYEIEPPVLQIIFTAVAIATVPFLLLYGITLIRLPRIRRDMQLLARITFEESSWDRADILSDHTDGKHDIALIKTEEKLVIELYENN